MMQKALFGKENIPVVCHEHGKTPWVFLPQNLLCNLPISVPFTEKRSRKPETDIKNGFQEVEH